MKTLLLSLSITIKQFIDKRVFLLSEKDFRLRCVCNSTTTVRLKFRLHSICLDARSSARNSKKVDVFYKNPCLRVSTGRKVMNVLVINFLYISTSLNQAYTIDVALIGCTMTIKRLYLTRNVW